MKKQYILTFIFAIFLFLGNQAVAQTTVFFDASVPPVPIVEFENEDIPLPDFEEEVESEEADDSIMEGIIDDSNKDATKEEDGEMKEEEK